MNILADTFELRGVRIHKHHLVGKEIHLTVSSARKKIPCPHCAAWFVKYGHKYDAGKPQQYQHTTANDKTVTLIARRNRYTCPDCHRVITEPLVFIKLSNGNHRTTNFEDLVLSRLAFSPTIKSVARELNLTTDKILTILKREASSKPWVNDNYQKLKSGFVLGIDEKHWLKRRYHLVLTSISDKLLIALGPDRRKTTVLELLTKVSQAATPAAICMDMWSCYKTAAQEVFGLNIPIVVDKFHVFSFVNRMILASRDILEYSRKQRGIINYSLPSFRSLLYSKKNFNQSRKARENYAELLKLEPSLKFYRDIRNLVEEMYLLEDRAQAERKLALIINLSWNSPCSHGIDIAKTFNRWFREIVNYFDYRYTNAYTEGINNKLELINRTGFGYRNQDTYLRRASLLVR